MGETTRSVQTGRECQDHHDTKAPRPRLHELSSTGPAGNLHYEMLVACTIQPSSLRKDRFRVHTAICFHLPGKLSIHEIDRGFAEQTSYSFRSVCALQAQLDLEQSWKKTESHPGSKTPIVLSTFNLSIHFVKRVLAWRRRQISEALQQRSRVSPIPTADTGSSTTKHAIKSPLESSQLTAHRSRLARCRCAACEFTVDRPTSPARKWCRIRVIFLIGWRSQPWPIASLSPPVSYYFLGLTCFTMYVDPGRYMSACPMMQENVRFVLTVVQ